MDGPFGDEESGTLAVTIGEDAPNRLDKALAAAVTFGRGWIAVVTTDDHILIFGTDGTLRQEVTISLTPGP